MSIFDEFVLKYSKIHHKGAIETIATVMVRNNRLIIFINRNNLTGVSACTAIIAIVFQSVSVIHSFFWRSNEMNPLINLCVQLRHITSDNFSHRVNKIFPSISNIAFE
eukprot:13514.XXX_11352_11744_1 [CDS] Oithona nana genome sequencing.